MNYSKRLICFRNPSEKKPPPEKVKIKKVATIDIGSNAIRLLISNVFQINGSIFHTKNSLHRVPVRLGQDSFTNNQIDNSNKNKQSTEWMVA